MASPMRCLGPALPAPARTAVMHAARSFQTRLPNGPRLLTDLGHDVLAQHYLETALQLNRPTLTDVTMLFLDIDSVGRLTEDD